MNLLYYKYASKKFFADNGFLHASALTFYTLFAVVPILATAFGVAKGFGIEKFLDQQLNKAFAGQEEIIIALSDFAQHLLDKSSGGLIAGVAIVILFYSIYSMLDHIEQTLNSIWRVPTPRSISLRINHYLSLALAAPIILVLSGSVKLYIAQKMLSISPLLSFTSTILSLLLIILLFTWLFEFVPNTMVKRKAALFGGVQAGIAYAFVQSFLVESQLLMNNYGAIYGSLAVFPIFLLWVQTSWVIVIFGTQLCFVYQNNIQQAWQLDVNTLSFKSKQELMLKITSACIDNFKLNKPPLTAEAVAAAVDIPPSCAQQLLAELVAANILIETRSSNHVHGYFPARNSELLDPDSVLESLNNTGINMTVTQRNLDQSS